LIDGIVINEARRARFAKQFLLRLNIQLNVTFFFTASNVYPFVMLLEKINRVRLTNPVIVDLQFHAGRKIFVRGDSNNVNAIFLVPHLSR